MDSNRLRYFLVVAEIENIRKAAEALHITPSALSKALKQLEYEIGTPLLVSSGRGISITERGKELARRARPLMEDWEKLRHELKEKKNSHNTLNVKPLRIGSFEIFSTHFLRCLVDSLSNVSELILREVVPSEMEKSLLEYKIDYGITNLHIPRTGIVHQRITFYELRVYGREDIFGKVPFEELPFAAPINPIFDSPNDIKTLDGWPEQINRSVKYKVDMLESALELCRQGKAVAYLPSFVVKLHNNTVKSSFSLQALPFLEEMVTKKQAIYLTKRKSDPPDQASLEIVHAITGLV